MSKPLRKEAPQSEVQKKEKERPHLYLVSPPAISSGAKQNSVVVALFLTAFALVFSTLFYITQKRSGATTQLQTSFFSLRMRLMQEGVRKFQAEKSALKKKVRHTLKEPKTELEESVAQNIAVYLFPEVLPDSNFEKSVAMEQWKTLQDSIENNPKSPQSRMLFEELRANIWNYENPSREEPMVSDYAKETIRLYDELSVP